MVFCHLHYLPVRISSLSKSHTECIADYITPPTQDLIETINPRSHIDEIKLKRRFPPKVKYACFVVVLPKKTNADCIFHLLYYGEGATRFKTSLNIVEYFYIFNTISLERNLMGTLMTEPFAVTPMIDLVT